jgi:hypothetical protein
MVSNRQVRELRKKLAEGKTMLVAADAFGMTEKSAHKWNEGAPCHRRFVCSRPARS